MRRLCVVIAAAIALVASVGLARQAASDGPYKVLKTAKVGGVGGFDYVYADDVGRKLYIPRTGDGARVSVFNLDTLEPLGEIPNANARGAGLYLQTLSLRVSGDRAIAPAGDANGPPR